MTLLLRFRSTMFRCLFAAVCGAFLFASTRGVEPKGAALSEYDPVTGLLPIPTADPTELEYAATCGNAGEGEERARATIDFVLCCHRTGDKCCFECKCQWARYWEMASYCFPQYKTYQGKLQKRLRQWNKDASKFCKIRTPTGDQYASNQVNDAHRAEYVDTENEWFRDIRMDDPNRPANDPKEWCGAATRGAATPSLALFWGVSLSLGCYFVWGGR